MNPAPDKSDLVVVNAPACAPSVRRAPNGYDRSFVAWFREYGWCVHRSLGGIDVWTFNDAWCHFRVTDGMIERLTAARWLVQFFPDRGGVFDDWFQTPEYMPDSYKENR